MRSQPRRSRIAHFKTPFIVSAAVAVVACGGRTPADITDGADDTAQQNTSSGGTGGSGTTGNAEGNPQGTGGQIYGYAGAGPCGTSSCNPPGPWPPPGGRACPAEMPVPGSDCYVESEYCSYPGCEGAESSDARCVGGQWLVHYSSGPACNPPAVIPVCPERAVTLDSLCAYEGQVCFSGPCSDDGGRPGASCTSGIWQAVTQACFLDAGAPPPAEDAGSPDAGASP